MWTENMCTEGFPLRCLYKGRVQPSSDAAWLPLGWPCLELGSGGELCFWEGNSGKSRLFASPRVILGTPQRSLGWIIILCSSTEPFVCRNQSAWLMWTCWYSEHPWDISRLKVIPLLRWESCPVVKIVYSSRVCLCECPDWTCPGLTGRVGETFFPLRQATSDYRPPHEKMFCPEKNLPTKYS